MSSRARSEKTSRKTGVKLAMKSKKTSKTLYIIHGWAYSVEPWQKTLKLLKEKGIKYKMLHVPGLTEPSEKIWTIEEYVEWANKNIPEGSIALGHSNGGRILLNLCSKTPEKLSHLILLDSAGVYEKSKKRDILKNSPSLRKLIIS